MQLLTMIFVLAVLVEYCVEGIKEIVGIKIKEKERIVSLIVSLIFCFLIPYIQVLDLGKLATLNIVERIILGVLVSRGSNALHDLLNKIGNIK